MVNTYVITPKTEGEFELLLENNELGVFSGIWVYDPSQIAWEFKHFGTLEGLEVYQKLSDNQYHFTAEYRGGDGYSTKIEGSMRNDT